MRQAGVIAAAGIVALECMVERLADDHARARVIADAVVERWPSCGLEPTSVRTNCVVFEHDDAGALLRHLGAADILAGTIAPRTLRFMTHVDVNDADVERVRAAVAAAP
jgi:threonine aldolase